MPRTKPQPSRLAPPTAQPSSAKPPRTKPPRAKSSSAKPPRTKPSSTKPSSAPADPLVRALARAWDERPAHGRSPRAAVSRPLLFRSYLQAAALHATGAALPLVRMWLGGEETRDRRLLPRPEDRTFEGWQRRVRAFAGDRRFAVVLSGLEHASPELVRAVRPTLAALFAKTGIPAYGVELGGFAGDYEATPFGVHQDRVGVWMSMLAGRKRVHVWSPRVLDVGRALEVRRDLAPILRQAQTLDVEAGEWAYWPAHHWHVGVCDGFAVSLNVGFGTHGGTTARPWAAGLPSERAAEVAARVVAEVLREVDEPGARGEALALDALERAVRDGSFRQRWAERAKAYEDGLGLSGAHAPPAKKARRGAAAPKPKLKSKRAR